MDLRGTVGGVPVSGTASFDAFVLKSNQAYLQGSYALSKNVEVYARLGGADMKSSDEFSDSAKIFGTVGLRGFFYTNGWFSMGGFFSGKYVFQL